MQMLLQIFMQFGNHNPLFLGHTETFSFAKLLKNSVSYLKWIDKIQYSVSTLQNQSLLLSFD